MKHLAWGFFLALAFSQAAPAEAKNARDMAAEIVKSCAVADVTAGTIKQNLISESKKRGWSDSKTQEILSAAADILKNKRSAYETSVTNHLSETYSADDLQSDAQVCKIAFVRQLLIAQTSGKPLPDFSKLKASDRSFLEAHMKNTVDHLFVPTNNKIMALLIKNVVDDLKDLIAAE